MKRNSLLTLLIALFGIGVAITIYWRCSNKEASVIWKSAEVYATLGDQTIAPSQATTSTTTTNATPSDTPGANGNSSPANQAPPGASGDANANPSTAPSQSATYDGPCGAGGICSMDSLNNTMRSMHSIHMNFQFDSAHTVLIMSFLKDELMKNQPTHLRYLQDPSRLYKFHSTYSLSGNPLLSKLGLPPNSRIRPEDSCIIQDEKDGKIIVNIKFSHD